RVFAKPLPIEGLLDIAGTDDLVVRAWRMRGHPEFVAEREQGREEGREQGLRDALRAVVTARFGAIEADLAARIDTASTELLARWVTRAMTVATPAEIVRE
ncbi:MAG: hypothetical protein AB7T06_38960, partial [Kofleriaceae bacterium]